MPKGLTPRQGALLRAIERLAPAPADTHEIRAELTKEDPNYPIGSMYSNLTVLREKGLIRRRPPTADEKMQGERSTHTRFLYEPGQQVVTYVDPRTKGDRAHLSLYQQLELLYRRREELLSQLEPINEAIALAEKQVKELLDFIEQHR